MATIAHPSTTDPAWSSYSEAQKYESLKTWIEDNINASPSLEASLSLIENVWKREIGKIVTGTNSRILPDETEKHLKSYARTREVRRKAASGIDPTDPTTKRGKWMAGQFNPNLTSATWRVGRRNPTYVPPSVIAGGARRTKKRRTAKLTRRRRRRTHRR
jgi:hypothetical protein